jgi:hypothetical protein
MKFMNREFVRLPEFEKQCEKIGLMEDDIQKIENVLLLEPTAGDVMNGTGGLLDILPTPTGGGFWDTNGTCQHKLDLQYLSQEKMPLLQNTAGTSETI